MYKLSQHGYFLTNVNVHLKRSEPYRAVPYRAGATSVNALLFDFEPDLLEKCQPVWGVYIPNLKKTAPTISEIWANKISF